MRVIYLHGFNSSGNAHKSQLLSRAILNEFKFSVEYLSPDLFFDPSKTINLINSLRAEGNELVFIGSSLGGFYAQYFASQYPSAKIILINPVISLDGLLVDYYGKHQNPYTGEIVEISDSFVRELKKYIVTEVHNPERFLLLLQTDDDVLDYRQALNKFPYSPKIIRTGGGHIFSDFESVIPDTLSFIRNN